MFHFKDEDIYLEAREWVGRGDESDRMRNKCADNEFSSRIGRFDELILFIPLNFNETIIHFETIINTRAVLKIDNRDFWIDETRRRIFSLFTMEKDGTTFTKKPKEQMKGMILKARLTKFTYLVARKNIVSYSDKHVL